MEAIHGRLAAPACLLLCRPGPGLPHAPAAPWRVLTQGPHVGGAGAAGSPAPCSVCRAPRDGALGVSRAPAAPAGAPARVGLTALHCRAHSPGRQHRQTKERKVLGV